MHICKGEITFEDCKLSGYTDRGSFAFSPVSYTEKEGVVSIRSASNEEFILGIEQIPNVNNRRELLTWLSENICGCIGVSGPNTAPPTELEGVRFTNMGFFCDNKAVTPRLVSISEGYDIDTGAFVTYRVHVASSVLAPFDTSDLEFYTPWHGGECSESTISCIYVDVVYESDKGQTINNAALLTAASSAVFPDGSIGGAEGIMWVQGGLEDKGSKAKDGSIITESEVLSAQYGGNGFGMDSLEGMNEGDQHRYVDISAFEIIPNTNSVTQWSYRVFKCL